MLKKKKENIYPQATPCDANFITSVSCGIKTNTYTELKYNKTKSSTV